VVKALVIHAGDVQAVPQKYWTLVAFTNDSDHERRIKSKSYLTRGVSDEPLVTRDCRVQASLISG
jgi:hypothetical protein